MYHSSRRIRAPSLNLPIALNKLDHLRGFDGPLAGRRSTVPADLATSQPTGCPVYETSLSPASACTGSGVRWFGSLWAPPKDRTKCISDSTITAVRVQ